MKNSRNSSGLSSNTWNDDTNQQSQNENSEYTGFDSPVYDDKIITENVNVKNTTTVKDKSKMQEIEMNILNFSKDDASTIQQ